jgi:hypothetical protein
MRLITLLTLLLLTSKVYGLELSVPDKVEEHSLVVLSFEHEGFALVEIEDKGWVSLQPKRLLTKAPVQGYCFTGPPGTYRIEVTTFDPEIGFNKETKTIQILGDLPPPEDPEDPEDPVTPIGDYKDLTEQVKKMSTALNDEATRTLLHKGYKEASQLIAGKTMEEAKPIVFKTISDTMKLRSEEGFNINWAEDFRFPLDKLIIKLNLTSVSEYQKVLLAISKGLQ